MIMTKPYVGHIAKPTKTVSDGMGKCVFSAELTIKYIRLNSRKNNKTSVKDDYNFKIYNILIDNFTGY